MKISEIKDKGLRELAELRRKQDDRSTDFLIRAFVWDDTLEGDDYWTDVYEGRITTLPILKMEWDNSKVNENLLKENESLKKQIEDLEVINSSWEKEMELQLKYSAWERKEKRKLIALLEKI
jgi:hypothetical protein